MYPTTYPFYISQYMYGGTPPKKHTLLWCNNREGRLCRSNARRWTWKRVGAVVIAIATTIIKPLIVCKWCDVTQPWVYLDNFFLPIFHLSLTWGEWTPFVVYSHVGPISTPSISCDFEDWYLNVGFKVGYKDGWVEWYI